MNGSRATRIVTISRVTAPKAHDLLADQLREAILTGEVSEGDALPSERELVERTGLTRGSVRGALRTLVAEGLVQPKPGRFGGNVVTLPGKDVFASGVGRFVRGRRMTLRTLHETRDALECTLARLAALHRTDADIATLRSLHRDLVNCTDDFHGFAQVNADWHAAIARASGNELLSAMLYAISYGVALAMSAEEYDTPETRKQVIRIHEQIMEAIAAGQPEAAERRMRQHIGAAFSRARTPENAEVAMSEDAPGMSAVATPPRAEPSLSPRPARARRAPSKREP